MVSVPGIRKSLLLTNFKWVRLKTTYYISFKYNFHFLLILAVLCLLLSVEQPRRKTGNVRTYEIQTNIDETWERVILRFFGNVPTNSFSTANISRHYNGNKNLSQNVSVLVRLNRTNFEISPTKLLKSGQSRLSPLLHVLRQLVEHDMLSEFIFPGRTITFLVMLNDGHRPRVPTFGSAKHWNSWSMMFPVPLGNERGEKQGWGTPLLGWDKYINRTIVNRQVYYRWEEKRPKAVFRGALGMQRYKLGSCNKENHGMCENASSWADVNRGVLATRAKGNAKIFDIGFTSYRRKPYAPKEQMAGAPPLATAMLVEHYQKYKLVLSVGSNQDWAERLRTLLYMNSAVVLHQAESEEFFTSLLQPWVHFVPTDTKFTDLVKNVEWALLHDEDLHKIVKRANQFSRTYLSEKAMLQYWKIHLREFSKRQYLADGYS